MKKNEILEELAEIADQLNSLNYKEDDSLVLEHLSRLEDMEKELSGQIVLNPKKTKVLRH